MNSRNAAWIILTGLVALRLTVLSAQAAGSNAWAWIKGSTMTNQLGVYGTQGVPAANNAPGGRNSSVAWMAGGNAFWLFGGLGYAGAGTAGKLNDVWKFDPAATNWTWIKGSTNTGQKGIYGARDVAAATNTPGARCGAVAWTDDSGALWLFGGQGYDALGVQDMLNDVWKFEPAATNWTWIKGSTTAAQYGVYGTQGVPAATNTPGARYYPVAWTNVGGALWIFGGEGRSAGGYGDLNDVWKFDPATTNWTWIKGSTNASQYGAYGTQGAPNTNNTPGARNSSVIWTDAGGALWLFGGLGYAAAGSDGDLNDLWQYNAFGAIALASNALVFSAPYQGTNPAAQLVGLTNAVTHGFALTYTNAITYSGGASGWLTVSPAAGAVGPGDATVLTNQVAITGLSPGSYSATNRVTADADNSPQTVVVILTVSKGNQTITNFPNPGSQLTTNTVHLFAQAFSSLPVTNFVASGPAVISGLTNLTFIGSGSVTIVASQAGDTNWNAAPNVTNTFSVTKAGQAALTFSPASPQTYNTTNGLSASGGSGSGAVSYAVLSGPGQIVGAEPTNLWITSGTGRVQVCATKAADDNYNSSATTAQVAAARADQAITFAAIPDQHVTNRVVLSATASSSLAATFAVGSGPAILNANVATFSATGLVSIVAAQAGNAFWNPASPVTNTFHVTGDPAPTLPAPTGLAASEGNYWDKVRVTWNSVAGATHYLIFRSLTNSTASASQIGSSPGAAYDDTAATNWPETILYYWVKAANAQTASVFSASTQGSCAPDLPMNLPLSGDFDGDRKNDLALYQESSGIWSFKLSASGYSAASATLGGIGYQPIAKDFDGDTKTDLGVYAESSGGWAIMLSGSGYLIATLTGFGEAGYVPVVGDFDGDLKADPALCQENDGRWLIKLSASGYGTAVLTGFGGDGATAMALDFDGDGKVDPAIYQTSTGNWTVKLSGSGYAPAHLAGFGGPAYLLVSGRYDNDARADAAIYNPANGNWTILLSASRYITATLWDFGGAGFTAVVGDFDGDGKADPTLYQQSTSTWFVKLSGSGYATVSAQQ